MATQRRLFLGRALIIGLICGLPASAQSLDPKRCTTASDLGVDDRIAGCTVVIERGKPGTPRVIEAHFARAGAYFGKGDVDHAIDDYKLVIEQSSAGLLAAFDRAAPDPQESEPPPASGFERAFGRDGYRAQAYRALGIASFQAGLLEQSQDDLRRFSEIDPKNAAAALWLDLARRRAGLASELAESAKRLDMSKWPAPIVRLYLGQQTPEAVLAAAGRGGPAARRKRGCGGGVFFGGTMLAKRGGGGAPPPIHPGGPPGPRGPG